MEIYIQYLSNNVGGLPVIINHETGCLYMTRDTLAIFTAIHPDIISRYAEAFFKASGEVFEAEVQNVVGPVTLHSEAFILSLTRKYRPDLMKSILYPGFRNYLFASDEN